MKNPHERFSQGKVRWGSHFGKLIGSLLFIDIITSCGRNDPMLVSCSSLSALLVVSSSCLLSSSKAKFFSFLRNFSIKGKEVLVSCQSLMLYPLRKLVNLGYDCIRIHFLCIRRLVRSETPYRN